MRKSRFSETQIVGIYKQQACVGGKGVGQIRREHGISADTFCRWCRRYAGMGLAESLRQRQLEQENVRLKRLLTESNLEGVFAGVRGRGSHFPAEIVDPAGLSVHEPSPAGPSAFGHIPDIGHSAP
jgi:putative transposase